MQEKRESNWAILVLLTLVVLAILFVIFYNKTMKENVSAPKKEEKITYSEEEISNYYNMAKLTYEEESVMTKDDIKSLDTGLTKDKFSDDLVIIYGLKDQPDVNIGTERISRNITDNEGYTYYGKYIKVNFLIEQINKILGPVTFNNKTIKLVNRKYVYDAKLNIYRIYDKKYNPNIEKVTTIESSWDEKNIYITEFVAYTKINTKPQTSYTRHNSLLPINITDKNIKENLDIIDKYKYTFSYNENVKKFFLTKIEYVK